MCGTGIQTFFSSCFVMGIKAFFSMPSLRTFGEEWRDNICSKNSRSELAGPQPDPVHSRCSKVIVLVTHANASMSVDGKNVDTVGITVNDSKDWYAAEATAMSLK